MTPEEIPATSAHDILKEPRKRQPAFKLRIADIHRGVVNANERNTSVNIGGTDVSKVNLIANVIDKFISEGEKRYASLTIDDASSQIRVKVFGDDVARIQRFEIGDTILVIGNIRFFNNEVYVLPEIVKQLSTEWLLVRKTEIDKIHSKIVNSAKTSPRTVANARISAQGRAAELSAEQKNLVSQVAFNKQDSMPVATEKIDAAEPSSQEQTLREKILVLLRQNPEGIDIDDIILSLHAPVDAINALVTEMLEEAEIYEPKPGRIRLL